MAYGACIQAAVLGQNSDAPSIYVRNVTPLTIGILSSKNEMPCYPVIKRNTPYPIEKKVNGRTTKNNQAKAKIVIYEGEQWAEKDNEKLGVLMVDGLTASSKGKEVVDICLKINDKGIISATAVDRRTKNEWNINIDKPQHITEEQLLEMQKSVTQLRKVAEEDYPKIAAHPQHCEDPPMRNKRIKLEQEKEDDEECPIYGRRQIASSPVLELNE